MKPNIVIFASMLTACVAVADPTQVQIGDGQISGMSLSSYDFVWSQCGATEGVWSTSPNLSERAVVIGDAMLRLTQSSSSEQGNSTSTAYLDRASLSPVRFERKMSPPDGSAAMTLEHTLSEDGYHLVMRQGEQMRSKDGSIGSNMYDGASLGLALSRLSFDVDAYAFQSSMIGMEATYSTIATLAGRETVQHGDDALNVMLVDVEWHHDQKGEIYLPGPNESGGRYWIVQNPPEGVPYVLRYQTDTYVVEFEPEVCPGLIGAAE